MTVGPAPAEQLSGLIFALLLVDPSGAIAEANPAAEVMLGKSRERLAGRPLEEVLQLSDDAIRQRLAASDTQLTARRIGVQLSERRQLINLTVSPLASHPGWRVVTLSDARKDDGSFEDSGRAPAILAHEIKNPLAAIRGAAQLLGKKLGESEAKLTTLIASEVDRIAGLVDRMQSLGSERALELAPCNVHEPIYRARETFTATAPGIALVEEYDPSIPPVMIHADSLVQVVLNLLANARDALRETLEPTVTIRTRFVSGMTVRALRLGRPLRLPVEVRVCDNGPGIDPAIADHVFDPFVSSKADGEGLGLALVKKLVRDMGGRIYHERNEAAGRTDFVINLPLAGKDG